nr:tetraketide alpha-pyrone reductase 1-like [Tanacetum cinerariifolium]
MIQTASHLSPNAVRNIQMPSLEPGLESSSIFTSLDTCVEIVNETWEAERCYWHGRMGYVHIDDFALCHILVYECEEVEGRSKGCAYPVSCGNFRSEGYAYPVLCGNFGLEGYAYPVLCGS